MKPGVRGVLAAAVLVAAGVGGWFWWQSRSDGPPPGFAVSNGRLEATRVDISTKFAGRLAEVLAQEGDLVEPGELVARLDDTELKAQLREAEAVSRQAEEGLREAQALLSQRQAELEYQNQELLRALALFDRGHSTQEVVDLRRSQRETANAAIHSSRAGIARARAAIAAAKATEDRLRADLDDYALTSPITGRVQYRLAEPGEVVAAGARVLTLLDVTDVYMNIYLPTAQAGPLVYGAEARIRLDAAPGYVIPAGVAFVAAEAQFTPKYVETASEREKLTFRVKVRIPPEVLEPRKELVKSGVPGVAWVRLDPAAQWPADLAVNLPE